MPPRSSSWRARQTEPPIAPPPRVAIDIKSAAAFPSLSSTNKVETKTTTSSGHISLSITPIMNYKASLEKVVPKTKPILLTAKATTKQESKEFVYDEDYECEDTIVHVEDEGEEDEYNANIMSDRRRGDKGFW